MNCMFLFRFLVATLGGLIFAVSASADVVVSFGSGVNQFNMTFVPIGSPNAADTTGSPNPAGAVSYAYNIGKYEVSEVMITKFNASQSLQITKDTRGADKPATSVSWNEAARFVNWLNTSQGFQAAYKFTTNGVNDNIALWAPGDAGYNANNQFRNSNANYFLPSFDEWYKAAYYDPNTSTYYDYATGSNTAPTAVANGTTAGTAVYNGQSGPADITLAGGLSPFGVMGLGGNVWEWQETESDLVNNSTSSNRGIRGGSWNGLSSGLSSSNRSSVFPASENYNVGFRVASLSTAAVPELGTLCSWSAICLCVGFAALRRRRLQAA
jgi:formylglycine-generating enzyme required for sulfatase activity